MIDKDALPYRPCAGLMVMNRQGEIFVARRIDTDLDAWQMPQGGIDEGEAPRAAALREMKEEIGTDNAEIIAETADWLAYDLPDHLIGKVWKGKYRGQKQKWFLVRFLGEDSEINIATEHPEFDAWRWMSLADVPRHIVPFKRDIYQAVCDEFAPLVTPLDPVA
ncbi:RNA pyrophosphohydrolase [Insolitispirillum peregrinum]|uniref:RNA pyrophosphohydrolase n=1 Tax=Insolitispirillum peregrinum TaxID=80876 RepID=A0A1N7JIE0_9PROT|nr:RNA pyrophosphohydrolase [Insolitispirillum peregrinum]SIS49078.1 putative (di)nucleoside polyphosphate hydrolase [Insolitispirillum peregrinum]